MSTTLNLERCGAYDPCSEGQDGYHRCMAVGPHPRHRCACGYTWPNPAGGPRE